MKRIILLTVLVLVLLLVVTACSGAPSSAPAPVQKDQPMAVEADVNQTATPGPGEVGILTTEIITTDFDDAANLRNQLAFGILELEGTKNAITSEQAKVLLPLWQAMVALSGDSMTVSEELNAVQDQIVAAVQPEQLQTIAALQITNAKLTEFYAEMGIELPTPVPGVTKVPGSKKNMSEADKQATRTANEASGTTGTGMGQVTKTLLFEEVIKILSARSAE